MGRGSAKSKRPSGYRAAYRLWAKSHRVAMTVLETVAGMAIVAAVALGVFFWYLSSSDISLSFLNEPIQRAVNARLPGYTISIRDTVLEKTGSGVSVRLKSLRLHDSEGQVVAEAPKAAVGIRVLPLLIGRITPHSVDLIGPRLAVLLDRAGRVIVNMRAPAPAPEDSSASVPAGPQATATGQTVDLVKALLSGDSGELAGLEEIGIRDASIFFAHQGLGKSWEISRGSILVTRQGDAMHVTAEADVNYDGGTAPIRGDANLQASETGIRIDGRIADIVPRQLAESFEALNGLAVLDLPVSAEYSGTVLDDGTIEEMALDARIGAGFLRPPHAADSGVLIDEGQLRFSYERATHTVTIAPSQFLSGNTRLNLAGRIVGDVLASAAQGTSPAAPMPTLWRFELEGSDVLLGAPDLRARPLPVERLALAGHYDLASGEFRLDQGELVSPEGGAQFTAAVIPGEGSPQVSLAAKLTPMSVHALKMIWPSFAAPGAYRWVNANIRSGQVTGGSLRAEFPAGLMDRIAAGEAIPDEALQAEFAIEDVTSSYLQEMPYIRGGSGTGRILGKRFELAVSAGRVDMPSGERLDLANGYVRMPDIADEAPPGEIGFDVAGSVSGILELLDHEPLGYPGRIGVKPTDFSGKGEVRLRLAFPLIEDVRLDDVAIEADAELSDFASKGGLSGHDFADGSLLLQVKDEVLTANGEILLDKHPARLAWRLPFETTETDPTRLVVGMTLDDGGRKKFGLDIPYVSGPVRFEIEPGGALDKPGAAPAPTRLLADLKQAAVKTTPFGWSKPAGVPGDLSFEALEMENGEMRLQEVAYDGDGARVRGDMVLDGDGNIQSVRLPVFNLSSGDDMSLLADRAGKNTLQVTMKGASYNAAALIESTVSLGGSGGGEEDDEVDLNNGEKVVLNAEIARVVSRGSDHLAGARANMVAIDGWVSALDISGKLNGTAPFRMTLGAKESAPVRALRVDAEDAGALLRLANFYSRAEGGTFILLAEIPNDAKTTTTGLLKIEDFRIHDEPVLSTIDSAARARARIDLNRPGAQSTFFDQLRVPFRRRPGVFQLGDSVLRGPAVGATISGQIDFARRQVDLSGTFIPAYGLNNMISRVPVLGQVLAGGENEGLLALSFTVRGATDSPNVVVNPLSVVTPGILRKVLFELGRLPAYTGPEKQQPDDTGTLNMPSWPVDPR